MEKHDFLSDSWFSAVEALIAEAPEPEVPPADVLLNVTIGETPFGPDRQLHIGAVEGAPKWGFGHSEGADVALTLGYEIAREIFIAGNVQAALNAFMEGKVIIQGDMMKLLALQQDGNAPGGEAIVSAIRALTNSGM